MSLSLNPISQNADLLIQSCHETIRMIETAGRVEELAQRHRELKIHYDTFHRTYNELWSRISISGDPSADQAPRIFERAETAWHKLEDQLLTTHPQIQINYGRPLVDKIEHAPNLLVDARIKAQFPYEQKVRGDGNCFYTSLAICYLQWLTHNPNQIEILLNRIRDMEQFPGKEEAISLMIDLKINPSSLQNHLRSTSDMFPFISFLRHAAALQMTTVDRQWMDFYSPESDQDPPTAPEYVANQVLKMGRDAQHYEINALCAFLGCQLWIIDYQNGLRTINQESRNFIGAIYRSPGHYSCLQSKLPPGSICSQLTRKIATIAIPVISGYIVWNMFFR